MPLTLDKLKAQLQACEDPIEFIDLLNELSRQYLVRDAKVAHMFGEQAETLAQDANYQKGVADSRRNQAYGLYYSGRYGQAIDSSYALVADYIQLEDYDGLTQVHTIIGLCQAAVSNYAEALEYHLKALEFARQLNLNQHLSGCYNNVARVYAETDNFDAALEHYQQAIDLGLNSEERSGLADVYNNMAELFNRAGRYDEALDYARHSIYICEDLDYDVGLARTNNVIGHIYTNWSRYAQAQEYLVQSKDVANHNDWIAIELTALHQLAKLHLKMQDLNGALDYLQEAETRATMLEQFYAQAEIHLDFAEAYKRKGDFEAALKHHEAYHSLYRQRFAEERDAKLRTLEIAQKTRNARVEADFQRERAEELEHRREEDRQYFERLTVMKDEFLSSSTHDLKNPLATIKTNLYLLRKTIDHPKALNFVERIAIQTERMNDLITDMLDLAKLETGRAIERESASMSDLIAKVIDEHLPVAANRDIALHFDRTEENVIFEFDVKLMQRVLGNLVSNAIKYTDDGGEAQVQLRCDGDSLQLTVSDTGVGIPPEDLPHIFENFYRVDEAQSRTVEGSGLGLAIVKTIVEQHHGMIQVESEIGTGTMFMIELPRV